MPASQAQTPLSSKEVEEPPASVEAWASYFCPEEVIAFFRQDRSNFTVNIASIQRPVSKPRSRPSLGGTLPPVLLPSRLLTQRSPGFWCEPCPGGEARGGAGLREVLPLPPLVRTRVTTSG